MTKFLIPCTRGFCFSVKPCFPCCGQGVKKYFFASSLQRQGAAKYFCLLVIFLSAEECNSLSPRPLWSLWSLSLWSLCWSDHQNIYQCQPINTLQHSGALKHYEAVFVKYGQNIVCFEKFSQIDWKSAKQLILAVLFLIQEIEGHSMHWTVLSGKSRSLSTSNCTLSSSITVSARNISLSVDRSPPRNE